MTSCRVMCFYTINTICLIVLMPRQNGSPEREPARARHRIRGRRQFAVRIAQHDNSGEPPMRINTATGPIDVSELGKTLMHEHLVIGFPGWDSDTAAPSMGVREMTAVCLDKIGELKSAGFRTLLDPCPNDLG